MDKIRSFIGFCPQHEILYENFTVYEHLDLIASVCYCFEYNLVNFES